MPLRILSCVCILIVIILFPQAESFERKLRAELNPGCKGCSSLRPLIHVVGDSETDSIHHVWDFTGKPSVLIAHTDLNTSLVIDWINFSTEGTYGSVNFTSVPHYIFTYILDQIYDFNDGNNSGIYSNDTKNEAVPYSTERFIWNLTDLHSDIHVAKTTVVGTNYLDLRNRNSQSGTVKIVLSAFGIRDHSLAEPHLLHTTNTTQMDIALQSFVTMFPHSRLALKMVAVSSDKPNAEVSLRTHKTIDDEHSPGIFTVGEYLTPGSEEGHAGGGYMQWRTVAYTSPERSLVNSTSTHESYPYSIPNPNSLINGSLVYSLMGSHVSSMSVHTFYVSFGSQYDAGYYSKTNYLYWSMLAGYGQPSGESISLLVIVLISLGLNLVSLLAVVAYVLIFTRRIRRNKNDLFFSH